MNHFSETHRMKEVDNLESIKEEWVCDTGSDNQPLSDNQQMNCEHLVDSLFEEAQKIGAKSLSPTEQKKQVDINIKLWKNGFTVNDDFRTYSDGASQQFLNSIKKGELPAELQGIFDKEEVDVKVEDKKTEVCILTKPVFQPFSGQGHRLGRVSHIKDFIEKYQAPQRSPPFSLATALPFLRLLDETLTLGEAALQNTVIIQRLKETAEPFRKLS
ncbi:UBX domain-containing protein 2A isoform X3 [Perognathus longimembris pacificus]|uniref:UBX domain-containing protein 2A isoform X3 n=1 Tax=Perognathus longimembris pacificus TaxID=214514 RepID=UPI002019E34C|nr:UBX domain-containing protein 2A isoform X3 [Perognathus longimembris pacificus]